MARIVNIDNGEMAAAWRSVTEAEYLDLFKKTNQLRIYGVQVFPDRPREQQFWNKIWTAGSDNSRARKQNLWFVEVRPAQKWWGPEVFSVLVEPQYLTLESMESLGGGWKKWVEIATPGVVFSRDWEQQEVLWGKKEIAYWLGDVSYP